MKKLIALMLIALSLIAFGCKTAPESEQEDKAYTPYSERPPSAKDYWDGRAEQDRSASPREAPPKAP